MSWEDDYIEPRDEREQLIELQGESRGHLEGLEAALKAINGEYGATLKVGHYGHIVGSIPGAIPEGPGSAFERQVQDELARLRIRDTARQQFNLERAADREPFEVATLEDMLKLPPEPRDRVQGWIPWNAGTILAAMRKTGKTTLLMNLVWSFLTGQPFLGQFEVIPVEGDIAFLNYELNARTFARWASGVGIPIDRLHVLNLRGKTNPLGGDPQAREEAADLLRARNIETVIIDPFIAAFPGESENDSTATRQWLKEVDRWVREDVQALDVIISDHMGKHGESTRGSTGKEDWADSIIYLLNGSGEDEGTRYISATGRDVDIPEDELKFDPVTRTLTLAGTGSRREGNARRAVERMESKVLEFFQANPTAKLSGAALNKEVGGQRGSAQKAARELVGKGVLSEEAGPRNARIFSLRNSPIPTYPDLSQLEAGTGDSDLSPPPLKGGGTGQGQEPCTLPEKNGDRSNRDRSEDAPIQASTKCDVCGDSKGPGLDANPCKLSGCTGTYTRRWQA